MRLFPLLVLAACGGGFNAPFSDGTPLAELTAAEVCEIQEAAEAWGEDRYAEDLCTFIGQVAGGSAASVGEDFTAICEETRDECLEDVGPDGDECDGDETYRSDCTATVGDLEDCYNEVGDVFADFAKSGCDPLTDAELEERQSGFETQPPACDLVAACEDEPVEG